MNLVNNFDESYSNLVLFFFYWTVALVRSQIVSTETSIQYL